MSRDRENDLSSLRADPRLFAAMTAGAQDPSLGAERSYSSLKRSGFFEAKITRGVGHGRPSFMIEPNNVPSRSSSQRIGDDRVVRAPTRFGMVKRSWKNLREKAYAGEQLASSGGSSSGAIEHAFNTTIRQVPPSSSDSRQSTNSKPIIYLPRIHIPKSRRERQSTNPILSGSVGSITGRKLRQ